MPVLGDNNSPYYIAKTFELNGIDIKDDLACAFIPGGTNSYHMINAENDDNIEYWMIKVINFGMILIQVKYTN